MDSNYKKRFWVISGAIFILALLAIRFGFAKTFEIRRDINRISLKTEAIKDAPARLQVINKKLAKLDQYIGDFSGEEISLMLMERAGRFCESGNMVIKELPEKHVYISNDYSIVTYKLIIEGDFKNLLRLLHDMESNSVAGRLHSADFESFYNTDNNTTELSCTFYVQAVGKSKE